MTESDDKSAREEEIGRLIAAAGPGPTAEPDAKDRVYAAVQAEWQAVVRKRADRSRRRRLERFGAAGIAASIVIAALALWWTASRMPGESGIPPAFVSVSRVEGGATLVRGGAIEPLGADAGGTEIGAGDRVQTAGDGLLALEFDGALALRLNVDSKLLVHSASRVELLSGTVYVDSGTGGSDASLAVQTGLGVVRHLGTQFAVGIGDDALSIRVREGRVEYTGPAGTTTSSAGENLEIRADGTTTRNSIAANDPSWDWASRLARLPPADRYRIDDVLAWVARERGLTLDYSSEDVRELAASETLSGLPDDLDPAEMLDVVGEITDFDFEIRNASLVVRN